MTPDLAKITVPMMVCTSFSDANLHSVGSMRAFQQTGSIERHAYTHRGPKWSTFYGEDARPDPARVLRPAPTRTRRAPRSPPVRLEIRDRADHVVEVRDEQEWPLARTDWRQLYLGSDGRLERASAGHRGPGHLRPAAQTPPPSTYRFDAGHRAQRPDDAATAGGNHRQRTIRVCSSASRSGRTARRSRFNGLLRLRARPSLPKGRLRLAAARTRHRAQHPAPARTHISHPAAGPGRRADGPLCIPLSPSGQTVPCR